MREGCLCHHDKTWSFRKDSRTVCVCNLDTDAVSHDRLNEFGIFRSKAPQTQNINKILKHQSLAFVSLNKYPRPTPSSLHANTSLPSNPKGIYQGKRDSAHASAPVLPSARRSKKSSREKKKGKKKHTPRRYTV